MSEKQPYFLKLDAAKFFPPAYWNALPESIKAEYRRRIDLLQKYEKERIKIIDLCGNDNLVQIIENESEDFSRRLAFLETTIEALSAGADYSRCETIKDMSKVYTEYLLQRLGF